MILSDVGTGIISLTRIDEAIVNIPTSPSKGEDCRATMPRDIRDLKLTKAASSKGGHRYIFKQSSESFYEKYIRILKEGLLSVEQAQNMVVIKTVAGMAMAVAAAVDALELGEVIGCIAGDDTIMCATKGNEEAVILIDKIKEIM